MEELCLIQWEKQPFLGQTFKEYFDSKCFVDVTLVCRGKKIEAHRLVLAESSPVLKKKLLERKTGKYACHPTITLRGMHFHALKAVIILIYHGEVVISAKSLRCIAKCVEKLEIRSTTFVYTKLSPDEVTGENINTVPSENHSAHTKTELNQEDSKNQSMQTDSELHTNKMITPGTVNNGGVCGKTKRKVLYPPAGIVNEEDAVKDKAIPSSADDIYLIWQNNANNRQSSHPTENPPSVPSNPVMIKKRKSVSHPTTQPTESKRLSTSYHFTTEPTEHQKTLNQVILEKRKSLCQSTSHPTASASKRFE